MTKENALIQRITEHFGSGYKAASALGVATQQYYYWVSKGKIPFKHGLKIEQATNGAIKAIEVWQEAGK